jgi:hypothetical protein
MPFLQLPKKDLKRKKEMKLGTKTLLFGAHQFLLHPLFVGAAWWKLYGAPLDPRLWLAFFVHDLGYLGKPNIDGPEGKTHPELGARIMKIFGPKWENLSKYHSRSLAQAHGREPSLLSHADKLATLIVPRWLYLHQVEATGEIEEYMEDFRQRLQSARAQPFSSTFSIGYDFQSPPANIPYGSRDHWYWSITRRYTREWVEQKHFELRLQLQQFRTQTSSEKTHCVSNVEDPY